MRIVGLSTLSLIVALFLLPRPALSEDGAFYHLGPGDVLQLGVFGVPDFGRRVTVNIDGSISVPFLGEVKAEGLSIHDLRVALSEGLVKDGRIQSADVTVEMVEYRPFYISGDVSRPGAVPYRPGLTVRHAVALAGGYDALRFRTENPLMTAPDLKSENESLWIDLARARARVISLKAELNGGSDIDLNPIYSAPLQRSTLDEIASFEQSDLTMRIENYAKQRAFLQNSLQSAQSTVASLETAQQRNEESIKLQQDAVDRMTASASKGLVMATRVDDERRSLAEIRSQQGDSESRLVQARHDRDEIARNIELQDEQHRSQLNDNLRDTTIQTEKLAAQIKASSEKLLYTGAVKAQLRGGKGGPELIIYRKVDGQTSQITAQEDTEIQPDDMLEVSIRPEQLMAPNTQ
jgi:polysaccharide export outer membrane protein